MKSLRHFPLYCVALAMLGIVGYCLVEEQVELLVVAATVAALSWYVTEGPRGRTLRRWMSNALVLAAAGAMILDLTRNLDDIPGVLGRFTIWLVLIKLYERRSARDHGQLMSLSLLLMLIGCSRQPPKMVFGVVVLAYGVLGVYVLLLYRLYAGQESMVSERREADPGGRFTGTLKPVIGRHLAGHLRLVATAIGIAGIVLSVLVFVIFPRSVGRGMLVTLGPRTALSRVSGYTDEVNLISGTRISESPRLQFSVGLRDQRGGVVQLPGTLLLRGATHEIYRNRRWTSAKATGPTMGVDSEMISLAGALPADGPLAQEFRFYQPTATLFSLYMPVRISTGTAARIYYDWGDQSLRLSSRSGPVRDYTVESVLHPTDQQAGLASGGRRLAAAGEYAEGISDDARWVRRRALSLLAEAGLPGQAPADPTARYRWFIEAAEVFTAYLQPPRFEYTLDLGDVSPGGRDPIRHFLESSRRGHCEYFASALTALCHTVGIPARLVAGYAVSEYDEEEDRYIARAWNAHAWVEVPSGRFAHTPIDPTPPAAIAAITQPPTDLAGRFGWLYQQMEGAWTDRFVEFDETAQADLLETLEGGGTGRVGAWWRSVREWMAQLNRSFYFGSAGYVWLGIVAVAIGIALVAAGRFAARSRLVRRALRLRRMRRREQRRLSRQLGFYFDMLVVLRRGGLAKPDWQSPLAWSEALGARRADVAGLVAEITTLYYAGRYGGRALDADEQTRARDLVRRLALGLRVRV